MAACGQKLCIGELSPATISNALGHEDAVRRRLRPMMQAIGQAQWIDAKLVVRTQIERAVGRLFDCHGWIAEGDRAQRTSGWASCGSGLLAHDLPGFTSAVLCSRNCRMRRLASLSLSSRLRSNRRSQD